MADCDVAADEKGGVASNKRAKFNFDEKMFKVTEGSPVQCSPTCAKCATFRHILTLAPAGAHNRDLFKVKSIKV